jgi:hypothetical protein
MGPAVVVVDYWRREGYVSVVSRTVAGHSARLAVQDHFFATQLKVCMYTQTHIK